jgi:hypothetical protein
MEELGITDDFTLRPRQSPETKEEAQTDAYLLTKPTCKADLQNRSTKPICKTD